MSITNRGRSNRSAFTLVELLVIIGIVSVLAAALFPVLGQARRVRDSSCLSGNKEINRAFLMYAQDYDDTTVGSAWRQPLRSYLDERRMAECPAPDSLTQRYSHIRDHEANHNRGGSANMTYHGGVIMPTSTVKTIFWGPSWQTISFPADKITGLDSFYTGFSNSNYAKTSDEYTGTNGTVGPTLTNTGHVVDASTASGGGSTSAILAEVCRNVTPDPSGNGYYPVYTDVKRGNANYCAYHSVGSCGGVRVQFAFFWNLDGDPGCDPQDTSGLHSQGLAALANVSAHELSEARTDPASPGAWYDGSGAENGDKCAWTFNVPLVTFSNGSQWKLQGEWSNAAYTAGTGYPDSSGQRGCINGQ